MKLTALSAAGAALAAASLFAGVVGSAAAAAGSVDGSGRSPSYQYLPPLREQAKLQDAWAKERKEGIPGILKKHNADAWIVSFPWFVCTCGWWWWCVSERREWAAAWGLVMASLVSQAAASISRDHTH